MLQVDVFWSYGIGAGCALAGAEQLRLADGDTTRMRSIRDRSLVQTLLFFGLVFTPMGMWLATRFPGWESMYALETVPPWGLAVFGAGVTLCGTLGCLITHRLLTRGRIRGAALHLLLPYVACLFTLIHGWDGTGIHRFLAVTAGPWPTGVPGSEEVTRWLHSPIAATLVFMALVFLPVLLGLNAWHHTRGLRDQPTPTWLLGLRITAFALGLILGPCLALAVAASLSLHVFGSPVGGVLWALVAAAVLRPRGTVVRWSQRLVLPSAHSLAPLTGPALPAPASAGDEVASSPDRELLTR
ncbi:hypothetical protein [Streptomyces syringium]|uniref:hypothetical protein n=1 Tax=Streptomyces syringium TaxID=76729 RepID=UPI00341FD905